MPATSLAMRTSVSQLREARRQLLDCGSIGDGLLHPTLQESWWRSQSFGLAPEGRMPGAPHASGAQLARAREHRRVLVSHAQPVMAFLSEQIADSGNLVILADPQGMLLHALGDLEFADRAARVALRPGAIWSEQWRGTNAIGTALAADAPVVVHGAEHYLERNGFLTCAAAPIADPSGRLLGVLDISGDRRGYHRHTLALVRSGARMIEHHLFTSQHTGSLLLRLHAQVEGLGTVTEGLVALSEDGWIVGANTVALELLGLQRSSIGAFTLERVLGIDMPMLLGDGNRRAPRRVQSPGGRELWLRLDANRGTTIVCRPAASARICDDARPPRMGDALGALDTGDASMHAVIERARKVLDRPIALLLQGESGVGKELFARAVHRSSERAALPFVAVNCAALPETLIEAELFGYRPGAYTGAGRDGAPGRIREAHGGTLFLDEIGDMPLAMQARLLRVLQERQVVPLGGGKPVEVDFRLVCATHKLLRAEVEAGRFREDLYYRVNGLTLKLPALRERSDLSALIAALLREVDNQRALTLGADVASAFAAYPWPGNLRQLCNVLRTATALMGEGETMIDWPHLPEDLVEELDRRPKPRIVEDEQSDLRLQARRCIEQAMRAAGGNMSDAARRLGISRNTLYRKVRELELRSR